MFINIIKQIFINNEFKKEDIIRYEYISQTLISIVDDLKLNKNLKWMSSKDYIKYNKVFIKKIKSNIDNNAE